jgi:hypothetical protein
MYSKPKQKSIHKSSFIPEKAQSKVKEEPFLFDYLPTLNRNKQNSFISSNDVTLDQSSLSLEDDFNALNPKNTIHINNKRIKHHLKYYAKIKFFLYSDK